MLKKQANILSIAGAIGFLLLIAFPVLIPIAVIGSIVYYYAKVSKQSIVANIFKKNPTSMQTINPKKTRNIIIYTLIVIVGFIVLSVASSFWIVIEAGQTGVQSLFGKVKDTEYSSGFHVKNPLVKITKMNIRTQEYTMSISQGEGNKFGADAITSLTKEGLSVDLDITVLYNLKEENASDVYRDVGVSYEDVIIRPQIRSVIREVIAKYSAKDIY